MTSTDNRQIAAIDRVLSSPKLQPLVAQHGRERVKLAIRSLQEGWRGSAKRPDWSKDPDAYAEPLRQALAHRGYQRVHNLSGTLIHTNLGRAPIPAAAWEAVGPLVQGNTNLEFDLARGRRGQREQSVTERLCALTGAEAATVVNNTAAALVLILNTLALGREVPVSRGELIEIGGSFRLPDIMRQSGCTLREVGTTNRTHPADFAAAITAQTGMLLKVHPSNYHIEGFTRETSMQALAALAREHNLPLCEDLGSGSLVDLTRYGLPREPTPDVSLRAGANLVAFSGDKLLGGVQSGIILGDAKLIDQLNRNPLKRALRLDKVALTLLDAVLKLYESPEGLDQQIPVLKLMTTGLDELNQRGARLLPALRTWLAHCSIELCDGHSQIGSGALPDATLPTRCIRIAHSEANELQRIQARLRQCAEPIIARLQQDALWLDLRGAEDIDALLQLIPETAL
ncbi:MAG: L-seryl-tRNA(Sec) selenium transferase [Pseudomonadales bacterium]